MTAHTPCPVCKDTGETSQYGVLDCQAPGCTAAAERAALNAYLESLPRQTEYDQVWIAYQFALGRRLPLTQ